MRIHEAAVVKGVFVWVAVAEFGSVLAHVGNQN
jgi:hypothetical protein